MRILQRYSDSIKYRRPITITITGLTLEGLLALCSRSVMTYARQRQPLPDSGKPLLSETLSPNDIAVDALEKAGRRRPARSELKRSKKAVLSL
jgi:hypothetical protein